MTTTHEAGPTYAELCAGYGGLGMGVQALLGGRMLWCSEFDAAPSAILAHRYGVPNHGDLTSLDWASMPRVDVLTAGFPCQPFSHAGKRLGANDARHLWPFIQEGIRVLRPGLVVLENVRGLLTGQGEADTDDILALGAHATRQARLVTLVDHKIRKAVRRGQQPRLPYLRADRVRLVESHRRAVGAVRRARRGLVRAIGAVVGGLADLGYDAVWYGLRAADVGAAHGRFRVIFFAWPADAPGDPSWFCNRAGAGAVADAGRGRGREAVERDGRGPQAVDGSGVPDEPDRHVVRVGPDRDGADDALTLLPTPAVNDMGAAYTPETWDAWTARMKAAHGNGNGHGKSLNIEALRLLPTPVVTDAAGSARHTTTTGVAHPGTSLTDATRLLPTPSVADSMGGHLSRSGDRSDVLLLPGVAKDLAGRLLPTPRVTQAGYADDGRGGRSLDVEARNGGQDWREYEPAIRRWEATLGRPAPLPTEPGSKGQPRLSPAFVEWMMGLPSGWVTDPAIGISRNDQLKALGNGVVPQQAAAATAMFLHDLATLIRPRAVA